MLKKQDNIIGLEAQKARLNYDIRVRDAAAQQAANDHVEAAGAAVDAATTEPRDSTTWKLGRVALLPVRTSPFGSRKLGSDLARNKDQ